MKRLYEMLNVRTGSKELVLSTDNELKNSYDEDTYSWDYAMVGDGEEVYFTTVLSELPPDSLFNLAEPFSRTCGRRLMIKVVDENMTTRCRRFYDTLLPDLLLDPETVVTIIPAHIQDIVKGGVK